MKLTINYDLINAILNVNEPFNGFKLIRNNKKEWLTIELPLFTIIDIAIQRNIIIILSTLIIQFGLVFAVEYFVKKYLNVDMYKEKSIKDLKKLVLKLEKIYIKTDYDLLLNSELYEKKYKINVNKNSFNLMEHKYILVPTYDFNNNIKKTSILQEHIIGTDEYVLSVGSPEKELKKAYVSI